MNEKLNNALDEISDKHLAEAENYKSNRRPWWLAAVAAVLVLAISISLIPGNWFGSDSNLEGSTPGVPTGYPPTNPTFTTAPPYLHNLVASPQYPEMAPFPSEDSFTDDWEAYDEAYRAWRQNQNAQYNQPDGYADSLYNFFDESIRQFLTGEENAAYSPLSVYLAMAMLAETTDGNSRHQILDLFGLENIEQLRAQVGHLWNAHYCADGRTDLLLANSLWLDTQYSFHQNTLTTLASGYFASSFHGDLGTEEMDEQLRRWLNENTGELLYDQVQGLSMDPNTVFALASTVFFTAKWESEFSETETVAGTFHSPQGDVYPLYMNQTLHSATYYWGSNFSAVRLELSGRNYMWLILPDEGYKVADILESDEYLQMTMNPNQWENKTSIKVNLSLPKFDVSSDVDLVEGMKKLGITDVFDPSISDFTPMTTTPLLYVDQISHAARVAIDEVGCVGAAYTVIIVAGNGMPPEDEIDFVLDRPFLFVVSSRDSLPIFAGTVMEP